MTYRNCKEYLTLHRQGTSVRYMATYGFIVQCKLFKISKTVEGLLVLLFGETGILKVLKNS